MNWSAIAAWVALTVAIISPVVTAIINNRHQLKLTNLEMFEKHRINIIESYLKGASTDIMHSGHNTDCLQYSAQIYLYAPKNIWGKIELLNKAISSSEKDREKNMDLLVEISQALSTECSYIKK